MSFDEIDHEASLGLLVVILAIGLLLAVLIVAYAVHT